MINNKDTTEHTCNACNKTLRKIQYLKKHIRAENVHTVIKQSAEKQTLYNATQIVSQCSQNRQYCFQWCSYKFYIFCYGTPQRDVP